MQPCRAFPEAVFYLHRVLLYWIILVTNHGAETVIRDMSLGMQPLAVKKQRWRKPVQQ